MVQNTKKRELVGRRAWRLEPVDLFVDLVVMSKGVALADVKLPGFAGVVHLLFAQMLNRETRQRGDGEYLVGIVIDGALDPLYGLEVLVLHPAYALALLARLALARGVEEGGGAAVALRHEAQGLAETVDVGARRRRHGRSLFRSGRPPRTADAESLKLRAGRRTAEEAEGGLLVVLGLALDLGRGRRRDLALFARFCTAPL
jgi:hypothetical protein